jgi:hypothetical protein
MPTQTKTAPAKPPARHTAWAVNALQIGAVMFAGGLVLLYLNPFWHLDDRGFLDGRVHWWNVTSECLLGFGLLIAVLALVATLATFFSQLADGRTWPYAAALLVIVSAVVWVAPYGFVRDVQAHFEWNSADGFSVFRLHEHDDAADAWHPQRGAWDRASALRWFVSIQVEPLLRGYFKFNDWQKMNGEVDLRLARILPVVLPVSVAGDDLTLEDPDETPLMRASAAADLKTVRELVSVPDGNINALNQGGASALILACQNPKATAEVVRALLAAGADVNLRSRNGYTALTWARARKNSEVIRILRRAGARP